MPKKIDRTSEASRRAALHERIDLMRATLAEAALMHERDPSKDNAVVVERCKADLANAREALEMFELALEAAKRQDDADQRQANEQKANELNARLQALHDQLMAKAPALVDDITALGPRYTELLNLLSEGREITTALVRLHGGSKAVMRLGNIRLDGHAELASGVAQAIVDAGFGVTGPSLSPTVTVIPPSGVFGRPPALADSLEALHRRRLINVESAIRITQPATTTNEETV